MEWLIVNDFAQVSERVVNVYCTMSCNAMPSEHCTILSRAREFFVGPFVGEVHVEAVSLGRGWLYVCMQPCSAHTGRQWSPLVCLTTTCNTGRKSF